MKFVKFIKEIVTSRSGISSKRVCGLLGWLVVLGVLIYCTINIILAPQITDMIIIAIMGLLGIDSVTGIWKEYKNELKNK